MKTVLIGVVGSTKVVLNAMIECSMFFIDDGMDSGDTASLSKKIEALAVFKSQMSEFPNARSIKAVEALAVYRGTTVGVEAAEAFELIREFRP